MTRKHLVLVAGVLAGLVACEANKVSLKVVTDIPAPVAARLPLKVGVYYDDKFANHVYEENSEDRPNWRIESGASQTALFDQILSSMFAEIQRIDGVPPKSGSSGFDLLLAPQVEEMQFSTPTEIKTEFYEAWVRYALAMYEPDGSPITTWRFEGYGKSSTEFLKNMDTGMNEAINVALRDAGAKFIVKFPDLPEIKSRVEGR